jgi:cytosine permease
MLPTYISRAVPNPASNRSPWYVNTAPTYFGIFLFVGFYMEIASGTIERTPLWLCMIALAVAGVIAYSLFYRVPAMLGLQTGYPLYVVGSSTFGTKGGYLIPGILMGLLQIGWVSVNIHLSTTFILSGLGIKAGPGTLAFAIVAILWGAGLAFIGMKGVKYVGRFSLYLSIITLAMLVVVFFRTAKGIPDYVVPNPNSFAGFMLLVQIVIGFFATAGAAGADFGMNNRDARDIKWGGWIGIVLAVVVAGGLPLLSVAGARAMYGIQGYKYDAVIAGIGGLLATAMFFLFAVASIPGGCFSSFIGGNSFATMIPSVPRIVSSTAAVTISLVLAITGAAANLLGVFTIIGASFGPICGAMMADYLRSGRKWAGPREGVNIAGYCAWAVGFVVGIIPFLPISEELKPYLQPASVYSFIAGFVVYMVLAKAGLESKVVALSDPAKAD